MTWNNKVIWSEGLFLQPQHFQQHDRYTEHQTDSRVRAISGYGWGFTDLELDEAQLSIGKIALLSAHGVFPDGTPFSIPADTPAPIPLDFPADVRDQKVFIGVALRRPGARVTDAEVADPHSRVIADQSNVTDENSNGERDALVQTGAIRVRFLLEREVTDAFACLGTVRVIERKADNQLTLDRSYIPPTLDSVAQPTLSTWIRELQGLLYQRGQALASRLSQPGKGGVSEVADFLLLQTVNRFDPVFQHLSNCQRVHPARFYETGLSLAGDLSTFRDERRPVNFGVYRHDDLAATFKPLIDDLRRSLSMVLEQKAIPIDLQLRNHGVRVAVIPDVNLQRTATFVLAVNAQVASEVLRVRFPTQLKIGPVERIRNLVNLQLPGVTIRALPVAPRQLPFHAGFSYFELETRNNEMWQELEKSGGLAMHLAGEFPGLELEFWAIRQ